MATDRRRVALLRPKPEHLNHYQCVNAPVISGVAEAAGVGAVVFGAGSARTGAYTVVRSATINYQRPARGGVTATSKLAPEIAEQMREELEKRHGCDLDVEVSLIDADNTPTGNCRFISWRCVDSWGRKLRRHMMDTKELLRA